MVSLYQQLLDWIGLEKGLLRGKFSQDVLWNTASFAVMVICGASINFIIGRWYSPAVLGVYNQVYSVYVIVSQFAVAGIHLSVLKYVAQYSRQPEIYRPLNTAALLLSAVFAAASSLILWSVRAPLARLFSSPEVATGIAYIAPGLFFFSINKVNLSILNGLSQMKLYAVIQALRYLLIVAILVAIAAMGGAGGSLPIAFTLAEIILLMCTLPAILKEYTPAALDVLRAWTIKHLDFGMRGFLSNVLLQMNPRVDVLILGFFWSDHVVGVYSFAGIIAEGLYQLPVVLRTNYNPLLVRLISEQKTDELKARIRKGVRITYAITALIGILVIALYPLGALIIQDRAAYLQSWPVLVILVAGLVLSAGYIPFGAILLQAGRPGLHTIMTAILVLGNILLNLLLTPVFGPLGAATATALASILSIFLIKGFTKATLNLRI